MSDSCRDTRIDIFLHVLECLYEQHVLVRRRMNRSMHGCIHYAWFEASNIDFTTSFAEFTFQCFEGLEEGCLCNTIGGPPDRWSSMGSTTGNVQDATSGSIVAHKGIESSS